MKYESGVSQTNGTELMRNETPKFDMVAKGVATGVVATIIVEAGRGAIGTLAKNPFVMFSMGLVTGYFAHKYRKEIISVSAKTAEHSKDFILRQKEGIKDMLAEHEDTRQ